MSFKNKSAHDQWIAYREKMSSLFEPLTSGNPNSVKERNFIEYLTKGHDRNFRGQLADLSDEDFLALEKIVNGWFDFQDSFDTFYSERIKRFNRYA